MRQQCHHFGIITGSSDPSSAPPSALFPSPSHDGPTYAIGLVPFEDIQERETPRLGPDHLNWAAPALTRFMVRLSPTLVANIFRDPSLGEAVEH